MKPKIITRRPSAPRETNFEIVCLAMIMFGLSKQTAASAC
jgi:hypothetical protein